jgi:hypothetical protein
MGKRKWRFRSAIHEGKIVGKKTQLSMNPSNLFPEEKIYTDLSTEA